MPSVKSMPASTPAKKKPMNSFRNHYAREKEGKRKKVTSKLQNQKFSWFRYSTSKLCGTFCPLSQIARKNITKRATWPASHSSNTSKTSCIKTCRQVLKLFIAQFPVNYGTALLRLGHFLHKPERTEFQGNSSYNQIPQMAKNIGKQRI